MRPYVPGPICNERGVMSRFAVLILLTVPLLLPAEVFSLWPFSGNGSPGLEEAVQSAPLWTEQVIVNGRSLELGGSEPEFSGCLLPESAETLPGCVLCPQCQFPADGIQIEKRSAPPSLSAFGGRNLSGDFVFHGSSAVGYET